MKTIIGVTNKKFFTFIVMIIFLINIPSTVFSTTNSSMEERMYQFTFSIPEIIDNENQTIIQINETDQSISEPGYPILPKVVKH